MVEHFKTESERDNMTGEQCTATSNNDIYKTINVKKA
jgi:hypothetical protein